MRDTIIFSQEYLNSMPNFSKNKKSTWYVRFAKSPNFENFRDFLEKYFTLVPHNEKNEILSRIRSRDFINHKSAVNELLLYAILENLGLKPEFQVMLYGKKPDLILRDKNNGITIIEVVSKFTLKEQTKSQKRIELLDEYLRKFLPGVNLGIELIQYIPNDIDIKKVAKEIAKLVQTSKDEIEEIKMDNWGIKGKIILNPTINGLIWLPLIGGWKIESIVSRIYEKRKKYKRLVEENTKFLICAFDEDHLGFSVHDLEVALFGEPVMRFTLDPKKGTIKEGRMERKNIGIFGIDSKNKAMNTSISGILYVKEKYRIGSLIFEICLFHNPFAKTPIDTRIFEKIPQLTFSERERSVTGSWTMDKLTTFSLQYTT